MNLVIDIGNTLLKAGVFDGDELVFTEAVSTTDLPRLLGNLGQFPIQKSILSTVAGVPDLLDKWLIGKGNLVVLDENTPLPIVNAYQTPATLGRDRLANACGAKHLFPNDSVLVIDAGTCLKLDLVTGNNEYLGGSIGPGLSMRFRALHTDTARLPLLEPAGFPELTGRDTVGSIQSGVVNGMVAEIEGLVAQYQQIYPRLMLVITGGDAPFFLNQLKSRIFAAPNLTLTGLNTILQHLP
jgi:type III pantothenate kinase